MIKICILFSFRAVDHHMLHVHVIYILFVFDARCLVQGRRVLGRCPKNWTQVVLGRGAAAQVGAATPTQLRCMCCPLVTEVLRCRGTMF